MVKKILASILVGSALLVTAPAVMDVPDMTVSVAYAQDVWVFTSNDSGNSIYVMDNTVSGWGNHMDTVSIKRVNSDGNLIGKETWRFNKEEGYVWAGKVGTDSSFAIAKGREFFGNGTVRNRPDLIAVYRWLIINYGKGNVNGASAYDWN